MGNIFDLNPHLEPRIVKLGEAEYIIPLPTVEQELGWYKAISPFVSREATEESYAALVAWFTDVAPAIPAADLPGPVLVRLGYWLIEGDAKDVKEGNGSGAAS